MENMYNFNLFAHSMDACPIVHEREPIQSAIICANARVRFPAQYATGECVCVLAERQLPNSYVARPHVE